MDMEQFETVDRGSTLKLKVFISHKQEDELTALTVEKALTSAGAEVYLDVLDNTITGDGERLTKHIQAKLHECTDVIVILSNRTKESWWVPFEIGMATENDMPIANFLLSYETLPEYLEYWPRLKNQQDVFKYVDTRNKVANQIMLERTINKSFQRQDDGMTETQKFYAELKKIL